MKTLHILIAGALAAGSAASFAGAPGSTAAPAPVQAAPAVASLTEGEVRKIDPGSNKITLRHGPIRNLDMPPMTMVFQLRDPALLKQVRVGDKVLFAAVADGGQLTVTHIQLAQ